MAHDIPTGSGNSIPKRMTCQGQAFSQLMERLGDLPAGYTLMADLREIKAISAVLREHMRTVDATLDSLRQDLALKVNGMDVLAMVDTRATHSFVTGREVRRLKLELKEHGYRIKALNSEAQPVLGVASLEMTLGPWSGKCSLMAVPLDDFDLILGKEFMATNKIFPIPHLYGIMIADERCPTFLPSVCVNANVVAGTCMDRWLAELGKLCSLMLASCMGLLARAVQDVNQLQSGRVSLDIKVTHFLCFFFPFEEKNLLTEIGQIHTAKGYHRFH
ncbi:hypothetical protein ACH5RR_003320 [Cinchona calisaya]|uniref:Uncharacterized protein n=1 Tax=Cinchona calisaya TaxID=153742 RepID=A0ABD3AV36_9GENT